MIRKILFTILLVSMLASCSDSDGNAGVIPDNFKIVSVKTRTLTYDDIAVNGYTEAFSGKIYFTYDATDRISSVNGGIKNNLGINSFLQWTMSDEVTDLITYDNDRVIVQHSINQPIRPYDKEFSFVNGLLISLKVTKYGVTPANATIYTYEHGPNEIFEKHNGKTTRIFYMLNGNLIKIERFGYQWGSEIINFREDIFFLEYDSSINYLKGKFFVNGAFYKAFSNNNFRKIVRNSYSIDSEGVETQQGYSSFPIPFGYGGNNVADIFEIDFD